MIYVLKRIGDSKYDENVGHVIRARNEKSARRMAELLAADEGGAVWLDAKLSSCVALSPDGPALVLLSANRGA